MLERINSISHRLPFVFLLMLSIFAFIGCSSSPTDPDSGQEDDDPVQGITVQGIDVSHHNIDAYAPIDWSQLRDAGYTFAFVKATDGYNSCWTDSTFTLNIEGGHAAGLYMGAYHYARPDLNADARVEAQCFLKAAGEYLTGGYLRPVLDLETGASLGKERLTNWVHVWMDTVAASSGVEPIFYTYSSFTYNLNTSVTQYALWLAHYTGDIESPPDPGLWADWSFWQYTDTGSAPGVSDPTIDLNLFNGDLTELEQEFVITD